MSQVIGISASTLQRTLYSQFEGACSRIRKHSAVKERAVTLINSSNPSDIKRGLLHIQTVNLNQERHYPNYISFLNTQIEALTSLQEHAPPTPHFATNVLSKALFSRKANTIKKSLKKTSGAMEAIRTCLEDSLHLVNAQSGILSPGKTITPDSLSLQQAAELKYIIGEESQVLQTIVGLLKSCFAFSHKAAKAFYSISKGCYAFLEMTARQKGSNLVDDSEKFCDLVESYISNFYMFKSYIQILGLGMIATFPDGSIGGLVGLSVFSGSFGVDFVMDLLSSLPAQRRFIMRKILGHKDEREQRNVALINACVARANSLRLVPASIAA